MSQPVSQKSFAGGEISPFLYGRTDQVKYETGLRTMRNMIALRQGGATNRPGTQFIDSALNGGNAIRFIPFIFNETGNGQSYVLEFGNQYIAFVQNGARIDGLTPNPIPLYDITVNYGLYQVAHDGSNVNYISIQGNNLGNNQLNTFFWAPLNDWNIATAYVARDYVRGMVGATPTGSYFRSLTNNTGIDPLSDDGTNWLQVGNNNMAYTIVSPYLQSDLSTLQFAESADVVTITHPNYPPYELKRLGATNWTLTIVITQSPVPAPTGFSANLGPTLPPLQSVTYIVTSVSSIGEESGPASAFYTFIVGNLPSDTLPFTFTWVAAVGVSYYNVYKAPGASTFGGFIGSTQFTSFTDSGDIPDFSNTPPIVNPLFNSSDNYPSTVGFVQQRRGFANTNNNPLGFWLSHPGSFSNFDVRTVPIDSDSIFGSVAGQEVNSIQHLLELKFMLLLTAGAEIYVQGNGNGVVTPSSINAATQSQYGSNQIRPLRIADSVIFNQALGNTIRDLRFDFVINGYNGNELTIFSSHLFESFQIVDWDFQKIPDSIVWAVRNDGVLLALTYSREQQMLAWSRNDFENGFVENVCCIPENGNYATYLCIKRVINGNTVRYIERMSSRIWSDELNATYLDCFLQYNGTNQNPNLVMQLTTQSGPFDQTSSAYQQKLNLTSNSPYFTPDMVGDQIFLSDTDFVKNKGNMVDPENDGSSFALSVDGEQIRCTIVAFNNSTQVIITPNKNVPTEFQNTAIVTWARGVRTVTGLNHLIGQKISVWADRFVVASPKNVNVTFQVTVASDGSITLDKCYAVIYAGLPMTSDLETLDIETSAGETALSKRKRQLKLMMFLLKTRTLFAGTENPDSNFDNTTQDALFQLDELKTGINRQNYDQPPELITDQDWILEVTRWNRNGRIFVRGVDPVPLTILAVSPGGDYSVENPGYTRV